MRLTVETPAGSAWIDLYSPVDLQGGARVLLALTHGAGGGVETPDLLTIRDAALAAKVEVALITQAYRVRGRGAPPKPHPQDAAFLPVLDALRSQPGLCDLPFVLGGRSNGARLACRTAKASGARAVVALAFPLHPPGKPEKSRLDELENAGVPVLVVQGERDPFGMPSGGPGWTVTVVAGDHALKKATGAVADAVVGFVSTL